MNKLNIKDFLSDNPKIKYPATKKAILLSQENPAGLYSDFDFFEEMLQNDNKILKWTAIQVLGNLSKVDKKGKIDRIVPILISFLNDKTMITAANSIRALAEIAANKPKYQEKILEELLKVEKAKYYIKGKLSPECRNVAIGQVVNSLEKFREPVYNREDVRAFLKRQTKNTRPKVKKSAENLLLKIKNNK